MPRCERTDAHLVVICINCRCEVRFAASGWVHVDRDSTCNMLVIAWPPAILGEEH